MDDKIGQYCLSCHVFAVSLIYKDGQQIESKTGETFEAKRECVAALEVCCAADFSSAGRALRSMGSTLRALLVVTERPAWETCSIGRGNSASDMLSCSRKKNSLHALRRIIDPAADVQASECVLGGTFDYRIDHLVF